MSRATHISFFNRDGTSRQQRRLQEIDPLFAKVDDRRLKDLLCFLWKMAEHLQYYDLSNTKSGDWQDFVGVEQAVLLSLIAATDTRPMQYQFLDLHNEIRETREGNAYLPLFSLLLSHFKSLQALQSKTRRILGRELFLSRPGVRRLEDVAASLAGAYLGYALSPDDNYTKDLETVCKDMGIDYASASAKEFPARPGTVFDDSIRAELYAVHQSVQQCYVAVIGHADKMVETALSRRGDYQPHVGLILSFLRLFQKYQDQLNALTEKHLDFYYRKVLNIEYQREIADKVSVIIQLAKQAEYCNLAEGTAFAAGKDAGGKEQVYTATSGFTANKAKIVALKSVYRARDGLDDTGESGNIPGTNLHFESLRAAVKADSSDGNGAPLDDETPAFQPFCDASTEFAKVGFAFAGPVFRLSGGSRTITITLTLEEKAGTNTALQTLVSDQNILDNLFEVQLSCEKGWECIPRSNSDTGDTAATFIKVEGNSDKLTITLKLGVDFPPVVDFDKAIHGEAFPETWPVCKLLLKRTGNLTYYEPARRLKLKGFTVQADVCDLVNLVLQNDLGVLKPTKPIQLFGAQPKADAKFYIGSKEVFSKKLTALTIKWKWIEYLDYNERSSWYASYGNGVYPPADGDVKFGCDRLVDNRWVPLAESGGNEFIEFFRMDNGDSEGAEYWLSPAAAPNKFADVASFKKYDLDQQNGFIRLRLFDNGFLFGHGRYREALLAPVKSTLSGNTITTTPTQVNPPLTPTIENVSLDYSSSTSHTSDATFCAFYHLHPFGCAAKDIPVQNNTIDVDLVHDYTEEASLFIGIEALKPPQNFSMLFQFVDGTGDLSVDMPDQVKWSYLAKTGWVPFDERGVVKDGTRGFRKTGIVVLAIPKAAVTDHPLMPQSLHWVRASVMERSRAVNRLASITPQAMELMFADRNNSPEHYTAALSAGTISKLMESVPQVKSVTQPFASYGGRPREDRAQYHIRVSERLRHKDRAVNLWDYERLVLENFPEIHKVKCLNHMSDTSDIHPGHVRVVVIPSLENLNGVNILRPAVSNSLRDAILKFLEARCSKLIRLEVCNPRYEQLLVKAEVTFHEGLDVGCHNALLSDDIRDFLTPWKYNFRRIHFYEKLHSASILNFIEACAYVDHLTGFSVVRQVEGGPAETVVLGEIPRTRPDSLFVSAETHFIYQPSGEAVT